MHTNIFFSSKLPIFNFQSALELDLSSSEKLFSMIKTVIFMDFFVRSLLEEAESDELNGFKSWDNDGIIKS